VAAFNIISSLIMLVMEKTRDIAILKTLGANDGSIRRIFVLQGLIIGCLGTTLGLVSGYGLCSLLRRYEIIKLDQTVYNIRLYLFEWRQGTWFSSLWQPYAFACWRLFIHRGRRRDWTLRKRCAMSKSIAGHDAGSGLGLQKVLRQRPAAGGAIQRTEFAYCPR